MVIAPCSPSRSDRMCQERQDRRTRLYGPMGRIASLFLIFMLASQLFSATARRNVEYGRAGDVSLSLDLAVPDGAGPFPAVIIVHGGGWIGGHREYNVQPLFAPLTKAGFAWFSISYRLATDL